GGPRAAGVRAGARACAVGGGGAVVPRVPARLPGRPRGDEGGPGAAGAGRVGEPGAGAVLRGRGLVRGLGGGSVSGYFAYRSHYEGPTLVHLKRFNDATVLDWFRNHWPQGLDEEAAHRWPGTTFGTHVYGFWSLPQAIAEHSLAPPRSARELEELLGQH